MMGVRWEYQTPWTDRFNQLAYFDPNVVEPLTQRKGLLRFVGRDGQLRYQSTPDKNNFAPRVGAGVAVSAEHGLAARLWHLLLPGQRRNRIRRE